MRATYSEDIFILNFGNIENKVWIYSKPVAYYEINPRFGKT